MLNTSITLRRRFTHRLQISRARFSWPTMSQKCLNVYWKYLIKFCDWGHLTVLHAGRAAACAPGRPAYRQCSNRSSDCFLLGYVHFFSWYLLVAFTCHLLSNRVYGPPLKNFLVWHTQYGHKRLMALHVASLTCTAYSVTTEASLSSCASTQCHYCTA